MLYHLASLRPGQCTLKAGQARSGQEGGGLQEEGTAMFDKHRQRRVIYNDDADQRYRQFSASYGYDIADE